MPFLMIQHRVENFERWKPIYDSHRETRRSSGCKSEYLLRDDGDPNNLVLMFEWDTIENARRFTESKDLRERMAAAGVEANPRFYFLNEVERIALMDRVAERKAA